jgi:hypothetical protein
LTVRCRDFSGLVCGFTLRFAFGANVTANRSSFYGPLRSIANTTIVLSKQCRPKPASGLNARSKLTKIDGSDTKLTLTVGNMNYVNSTLESVRLLVNSPAGYAARLARSQDEVRAAQTLRFEVFNLELNEGSEQSYTSGLDEDPFDAGCDHLIVEHLPSEQIVGTYRLQIGANAGKNLVTTAPRNLNLKFLSRCAWR